jgi:hypothetical protein
MLGSTATVLKQMHVLLVLVAPLQLLWVHRCARHVLLASIAIRALRPLVLNVDLGTSAIAVPNSALVALQAITVRLGHPHAPHVQVVDTPHLRPPHVPRVLPASSAWAHHRPAKNVLLGILAILIRRCALYVRVEGSVLAQELPIAVRVRVASMPTFLDHRSAVSVAMASQAMQVL